MKYFPVSKEGEQSSDFEGANPQNWGYPSAHYAFKDEEINLLDYWRVITKRKWMIATVVILCTALGFGITFISPRRFRAEITLMPINKSGGSGVSGLASQVSSLPMVGGALGDLTSLAGGKTKELVNILKSRGLAQTIILRYDLMKILFAKQYDSSSNTFHEGFPSFLKPVPIMEDGVNKFLKKVTKVEEEKKSGLIKIQVTMADSVLAAKVANQMVIELQNFIENNSLTLSKRNRIFLQEQLVKTQAKLLEAGKELNGFYASNKISSVLPQLDVKVGSYQTTPRALAEFREEFDEVSGEKKPFANGELSARVERVPGQVYIQYLTLNRELLAKIYTFLTQQYEMAKIDEAKEDLAFQVIDKAEIKLRSSSPNLVLNVAVAFLVGCFISLFIAFFSSYINKLKEQEKQKHIS